jgi:hypothetical protein
VPLLLLLLLGGGALALAAASSRSPRATQQYDLVVPLRPRPGTQAHEGGPLGRGPDEVDSIVWSQFASGPSETEDVHVGDVPFGTWVVMLLVVESGIEGGIKFPSKTGKKIYAWDDPPPGGAPVLRASASAMNSALRVAGPALEAAATAYGAPPGAASAIVSAARSIVDAIPDAVARGRVRQWSDWREGRRGSDAEQARVRAAVSRWRDVNGTYAVGHARKLYSLRWRGSVGELPEAPDPATGGRAIPDDPRFRWDGRPTAWTSLLTAGNSLRVYVRLPATAATPPGERRVLVTVTRS